MSKYKCFINQIQRDGGSENCRSERERNGDGMRGETEEKEKRREERRGEQENREMKKNASLSVPLPPTPPGKCSHALSSPCPVPSISQSSGHHSKILSFLASKCVGKAGQKASLSRSALFLLGREVRKLDTHPAQLSHVSHQSHLGEGRRVTTKW